MGEVTAMETAARRDDARLLDVIRGLTIDGEVTQSQIAREIGVSASALSSWLASAYRGDNAALAGKLAAWLAARDEKAAVASAIPEATWFLGLAAAKKILAVLSYAQAAADIAVIYGAPGTGKTRALEAYARDHNNTWLVTGRPSIKGVRPLLAEIGRAMRIRRVYSKSAVMTSEIVQAARGTAGLLIVDEAQHLEAASLEEVRAIHDAAGIGVALAGNETVYARIAGDRGVAFAQLFSRVGKRLRLGVVSKADALALARSMGVAGSDECELCARIAAEPGGLRGLVKTLRLASMIARGQDAAPVLVHIRAAHRDLSNTGGD